MSETNQEGYQTLGWIINQSEDGLFLVVAEENIQNEIVEVYQGGNVGIYDCRKNLKEYSFQKLERWIASNLEYHTFFIVNFQLVIQKELDLQRLNFSRDMLSALKKNIIFLTTEFGDNQLAKNAYDFYSFLQGSFLFF